MDPQNFSGLGRHRRAFATAALVGMIAVLVWLNRPRVDPPTEAPSAPAASESVPPIPVPVSVRELLANLVEDNGTELTVKGSFKGYVNLGSQSPRKMQLQLNAGRVQLPSFPFEVRQKIKAGFDFLFDFSSQSKSQMAFENSIFFEADHSIVSLFASDVAG